MNWKPYFTLQKVKHGLCNAHHLRELKALEQIEKEPWAFKMSRLLALANGITSPPVSRIGVLYDRIVTEGLAFHEKQPSLSKRKNKRRPGHNLLIRLRDFKDCVLRFLTTPNVPFTKSLVSYCTSYDFLCIFMQTFVQRSQKRLSHFGIKVVARGFI